MAKRTARKECYTACEAWQHARLVGITLPILRWRYLIVLTHVSDRATNPRRTLPIGFEKRERNLARLPRATRWLVALLLRVMYIWPQVRQAYRLPRR